MHIKKKIIFVFLAFVLVLSATATVLIASDEEVNPQTQRMESSLFPKLRSAVFDGLLSQKMAVRIIDYWKQTPDDELPHLYLRVTNMLNSKEEARIQEASFVQLLRTAVNQGLVTRDKAIEIITLWEQKNPSEQATLYQRLKNLTGNDNR